MITPLRSHIAAKIEVKKHLQNLLLEQLVNKFARTQSMITREVVSQEIEVSATTPKKGSDKYVCAMFVTATSIFLIYTTFTINSCSIQVD